MKNDLKLKHALYILGHNNVLTENGGQPLAVISAMNLILQYLDVEEWDSDTDEEWQEYEKSWLK